MRAAGLIGGGSPDPTQVGHHPCAGGGITHGAPWRGSRVVTFQWWEWWPYIMNSPNFGRNFEVNDDDWIWFILIYLKCSCRSRKVVKKVVHLTIGWGYTAANLPHFQVKKSRILRMSSHSYQASGIIHGCGSSLARGLPMLCTASTTLCRSFPKKNVMPELGT